MHADVGKTLGEAAFRFMLMEKLCGIQLQVQFAAEASLLQKSIVGVDEARSNAQIVDTTEFLDYCFQTEMQDLRRAEASLA